MTISLHPLIRPVAAAINGIAVGIDFIAYAARGGRF